MKTIIAICGLCMILATGAHAAGDPRKCDSTGGHISSGQVDGPTFCAYSAARMAFRRYLTAIGHLQYLYQPSTSCDAAGTNNLTWSCTFADGTGTVRFRALSNGWHTRVAVTCTNPATKPANLCR